MRPTIKQGNYLLVNKLAHHYIFDSFQRGEVVVFNSPSDASTSFVKRVIGLPGDTVEIRGGQVFVNSVRLNEPYIEDDEGYNDNMAPFEVPASAFFVLGDNRSVSSDSRNWGAVPQENIIGKAWLRYYPFSDIRIFPTADADVTKQ